MGRRKRIPYDPPHLRGGPGRKGRRPGPPRRAEQIFMSRRMFLARGAIVSAFAALAAKLGYMQVVERDQYRVKAANNRQRPETVTATRGIIADRRGKELAINLRTWEVRVIPSELPAADSPERARVLNHLINALNLPDALVFNPRRVPAGDEAIVYARTAQLLGKPNLAVEVTDRVVPQEYFAPPARVLRVNGQDVQVFLYPDAASRRADSATLSANGETLTIGETVVAWPLPVSFAGAGNVLTLLSTADTKLAVTIERAVASFDDRAVLDIEQVAAKWRAFGLASWTAYIETEKRYNNLINLEDDLSTDQTALCRAHLHELPGVAVMNRLEYLVANGASATRVVVKTGVPRDVALKLEANKLSLPGVELDDGVLVRRYPGGEAMSHILGYTGGINASELEEERNRDANGAPLYLKDDVIGKDGLERMMEPLLRGKRGGRMVEMDALSADWRVIAGTEEAPVPGQNLSLTIDLEFQRAVSEILREGIRFANEDRRERGKVLDKEAGAGAVVAIDPRDGGVLAMVSVPHYDNQLFIDGISKRKFDEYVSEEANQPLLDRALRGKYPPGSTLKLFHAASALHEGTITTKTRFTCTGAIRVPLAYDVSKGRAHPCWNKTGHQSLDVYEALERSCDIFFYNVGTPKQPLDNTKTKFLHYYDLLDYDTQAERIGNQHDFTGLGIDLIKKNLKQQFWFGERTGIDLPTEEAGVVPDAEWLRESNPDAGWSAGDTINVSIGQGYFAATPLQLAVNTAALANGGTIYQPRLVREAYDDARQRVESFEPRVRRRLSIAPEHLAAVKEGMRRVVHEPTGSSHHNADESTKWPLINPPGEPEIRLAGKTGTAEIGKAVDGKYNRQHAWFTCFAPLDEPEIVVTVIVEDGGEGSSYAVPVADRVLRAYFEITERRRRGAVLREDGKPGGDGSVLAASAAFPTPGSVGSPGSQTQD